MKKLILLLIVGLCAVAPAQPAAAIGKPWNPGEPVSLDAGQPPIGGTDAFKVLYAGTEGDNATLRTNIIAASGGQISQIDWVDAQSVAINPVSLIAAGYKAIIIYGGNGLYQGGIVYGDSLARFVDLGGGVLTMSYTTCQGGDWCLQTSRYMRQYSSVPLSSYGAVSGQSMVAVVPGHAIMNGVTSITGFICEPYATTLRTGSAYCTRIANWSSSGYIQCAAFDSAGRRTAWLGYHPNYNMSGGGQWVQQVANALVWMAGTASGGFKVLYAGTEGDNAPLRANVIAASGGQISSMDFVAAGSNAVNPANLIAAGYKAILVYGGNGLYQSPAAYGESLARFVERGGGVLTMTYTTCGSGSWSLYGSRFIERYSSVPCPSYSGFSGQSMVAVVPGHPIMSGVTSITGFTCEPQTTTLRAGSAYCTRIANWSGSGYIQCAAFDSAGRRTAFLGYHPNYNMSGGGQWVQQLTNALIWIANPTTHDVGVSAIKAPTGIVDSGATVTPACSVYNFGNVAESYSVRMKIGAGYNYTAAVSSHATGTYVYVTFPAWTATVRGSNAVSCSTELSGDATPSNDGKTGTVSVGVRDAECLSITAPTGAVDSGATVTPQASVRNNGTAAATFPVTLNITGGYTNTQTVTSLAPGASQTVSFTAWNPILRGAYTVDCTALLPNDMIPANDLKNAGGNVLVHDIGVAAIIDPAAEIAPGAMTPRATLHNYGTAREGCVVQFTINAVPPYADAVNLSAGLPVGVDTTIEFANWSAATGSYTARCSTWQATDQVPANDTLSKPFTVGEVDVAVTAIVYPTGSIDSALAIAPRATLANFGDFPTTFGVYFFIDSAGGSVYTDNGTVTSLAPDSTTTFTFTAWAKPHLPMTYATRCSVYVSGDGNTGNDRATGTFTIYAPGVAETGWVRKLDLPLGAKSKKIKDGGALAYLDGITDVDTGFVYAFKGNNRYEFYGYNTTSNTWNTLESIPAIGRVGKKKAVKKGSALTAWGGKVYGAKGNNSLEWWTYDPALHTWAQKADVPTGAKNLKEGTGAVSVTVNDTAWVYLLRGTNSTDFHRYNIAADAWESKAPAPVGASGKNYKNGSCLAISDDGTTIYALKGSYNELAAYDIAANAWTTKTSLPLIGRLGKKKKVKDGAGMAYHNGYVYATKGGNTNEFWKYKADTLGGPADVWTQIEDVPMGSGRNVKGGGAMTCARIPTNPGLYVFKGNNTQDFFKFGFSAYSSPLTANHQPAVQSSLFNHQSSLFNLRIAPNPFSNATTISYSLPNSGNISLKLYDISGKLVTTLAEGYRTAGSSSFIVHRSSLSSGIYLIKLVTATSTTTTKLIVE